MRVLKAYLEQQDLTQRQFAALVGCSQSLVSQWLSGTVVMTGDWALEIERKTHRRLKRQQLLPKLYEGMAA